MPHADPARDLDELLRTALANHQGGELAQAQALYLRVLAGKPDHPDALHLLGLVAHQQANHELAMELIRKAIGICSSNPAFHGNLGLVCVAAGRTEEALRCFQSVLDLQPGNPEAHNNLSQALQGIGRWDEALACSARALQRRETTEFKQGFIQCLRRGSFTGCDPATRAMIVRALRESWCNPTDIASTCMDLIKSDREIEACFGRAARAWPGPLAAAELYGDAGLAAVSSELLLQELLASAMASSLELEWFLTRARSVLLAAATGPAPDLPAWDAATAFHGALARQCFLNEYAFIFTPGEYEQALALRGALEDRLAAGAPVPLIWPLAVAAFFPLGSLASAAALLDRAWPEPVRALLRQQIEEPLEEQRLRSGMLRLTVVEDEVSRQVQAQYEENPYPRWEKATGGEHALPLDVFLRRTFPNAPLAPFPKDGVLEGLIAGCGTGQHPIKTAQQIQGARLLALDLSLTSLGYAQRKTRALGLEQIEYAQADILNLGSLDRRFDLIESVGVLHHLADPVAGWKVLLGLLRPGGFMKLGLYSRRARQDIHEARGFIAGQGYPATPEGIRSCRRDLMTQENVIRFRHLVTSLDFFGTSPCRDLLFHVQEHVFTLPALKEILEALELNFLGFELQPGIMDRYLVRFPEDACQTDLFAWDRFEAENPLTFRGMYQFWVQKAPGKKQAAS